MREPVTAYVGLGANLGDAAMSLRHAIARIAHLPGTQLVCQSSFYRTAPVGAGGPDYINAVVEIRTQQGALELLDQLQRLENEAGRERPYPNAPRTLDLDLLLFGADRIDSARLTLPHPRMQERAFVLVPLAEIAPALVRAEQLEAVAGQAITRLPPA